MQLGISKKEAKRSKDAIEKALKAGYAPPNSPGKQLKAITVAAEAMGIVRSTLASRVASGVLKDMGFEPDWSLYKEGEEVEIGEIEAAQDPVSALKDELKSLRRRLKEVEEQDSIDKVAAQIIGTIAQEDADPPKWLIGTKSKSKAEHVPLTIWSDWHCGEMVAPDEIHGLNEFNSRILEKRVKKLVETTIHLCRNHGPGNYPGAVVGLLGDFISGGLHPELVSTDELTNVQSVLHARDLLAWGIDKMAEEFGRVFLPCVSGNHGRTTPKPQYKQTVYTNYDWLIYELLRRHFDGRKEIVFANPVTNEVHFKIFDRRYLATHGDMLGVRGGDGIIGSIGPIMRGSMKVGRQAAAYKKDFDVLLMGHWHQPLYLPGIIVANSLKGYDEYAARALRAPYSVPSQPLVFCNAEFGHVSYSEIFLDSARSEKTEPWVQWAV